MPEGKLGGEQEQTAGYAEDERKEQLFELRKNLGKMEKFASQPGMAEKIANLRAEIAKLEGNK